MIVGDLVPCKRCGEIVTVSQWIVEQKRIFDSILHERGQPELLASEIVVCATCEAI